MTDYLIVNADDFGLEEEVNAAVIAAHRNGIVTSASLIANGRGFYNAVALARENPNLGVGAHLSLTRGPSLLGGPILGPSDVPSLVRGDGLFPQNPTTLSARILMGFVKISHIRKELAAQLERIHSAGVRISHIDSHQHIHLCPPVFRIVVELASQYQVQWLRMPLRRVSPGNASLRGWLKGGTVEKLAARNMPVAVAAGLRSADCYAGIECAGHLSEDGIEKMLMSHPGGMMELLSHPGLDDAQLSRNHPWNYKWSEELSALCSIRVREVVKKAKLTLTNYLRLGDEASRLQ
ncbi:MAG: hopanoid biosynthesis-associated protein HpnK [Candidatus Abyssubacteria bacterium]